MRFRLVLVALVVVVAAFALGRCSVQRERRQQPAPSRVEMPRVASPGSTGAPAAFPPWTDRSAVLSYERVLYAQPRILASALATLRPETAGKTDLYAIGFAGDEEQDVFQNEVAYLSKLLAGRFAAAGRTLQLVNAFGTLRDTPLATRSNLRAAIAGVAATMDRDDDILLLFVTSHGSRDHRVAVEMGDLPLDQLTPEDVRDALDEARIRWRVIVVSACYSGGFIPALREPHTLVITAARGDRTSFGCSADADLTWFGQAFLVDALNQTTDFRDAWDRARKEIAGWERRDHETPSEPQLWAGALVGPKLATWRATLPAAPVVPFVPPTPTRRKRG